MAARGDHARLTEAVRAYLARGGGLALWRRAQLLAAGDRDGALELWTDAVAGVLHGWRSDSDDIVETHLALRGLTRRGADLQPEPGPKADEPDGARTGDGPPPEIASTWRRLARLDPGPRAALVAACLDDLDDSTLAAALGRRPKQVRDDLEAALSAWPPDATRSEVAADLNRAGADAAAPTADDLERALTGGADHRHGGGRLWRVAGRRAWRGPGRRTASASRPRAAVALVAGCVLVALLAGARQLSASAPPPPTESTPEAATAETGLRGPTVAYDDLVEGPPARLGAYVAGGLGGLAYVDGAGRVPLPGGAAWGKLIATGDSGTFLLLPTGPPQGDAMPVTRVVTLEPDQRLRTIAQGWIAEAAVSSGGLFLAYLRVDGPLTRTPTSAPEMTIVVARVVDGATLATRRGSFFAGMGWLGDRLLVGEGSVVASWAPPLGWREHPLLSMYQGPTVVGGTALLQRPTGPSEPSCLHRWTPGGGLAEQAVWCDPALVGAWEPAPDGRRVLVMQRALGPGSGDGFRWGVLEVSSGRHVPFAAPNGFFPLGGPAGLKQTWEGSEHVILTDSPGPTGGSPRAVRCEVTTGHCERTTLPAGLS